MVDAGPEPTYEEKMRVPPKPWGLSISSNLSLLNAYKWAFVLVGFVPVGFCPSGLLSYTLVQPRMTRPYITERLLMGRKESNQTTNLHLH